LYSVSKIDLVKGYHKIPVATEDIPKTAIITVYGLFEYLFTPFGLSNTAQTFQRMMDQTTDGLEGVFAYRDDSQVGSAYRQTHLRHLEAFFTALATNGMAINLAKCVFGAPSLKILGHNPGDRISPHGRSCRRNRKLPTPSGYQTAAMFSWHSKLLPLFSSNCTQVLKPLTDLLKGGAKTLEWTASDQEAFQHAKPLLAAAEPLQHPAPNAELSLLPLTPLIHISEGSCSKNLETIGGPLFFFPVN
jgi:hypothetical protein